MTVVGISSRKDVHLLWSKTAAKTASCVFHFECVNELAR